MKVRFELLWPSKNSNWQRAFKLSEAGILFKEYVSRISQMNPCDVKCVSGVDALLQNKSQCKTWLCERNPNISVSSEELAKKLNQAMNSGISELRIVIGGPNGISKDEKEEVKPDFLWSFGALTLPHELAAVIASEQIYRAFSILKHLPYHCGH